MSRLSFFLILGCSLTETRPTQEMINAFAALRAAKETQAEKNAAGLYQQAREWLSVAKKEFKFKNFKEARIAAEKSRSYSEEAEFRSILKGASRSSDFSDPLDERPLNDEQQFKQELEVNPYEDAEGFNPNGRDNPTQEIPKPPEGEKP